jgi:hypothetical protein
MFIRIRPSSNVLHPWYTSAFISVCLWSSLIEQHSMNNVSLVNQSWPLTSDTYDSAQSSFKRPVQKHVSDACKTLHSCFMDFSAGQKTSCFEQHDMALLTQKGWIRTQERKGAKKHLDWTKTASSVTSNCVQHTFTLIHTSNGSSAFMINLNENEDNSCWCSSLGAHHIVTDIEFG